MKKLNIFFFSANRAEYGLIYPFLKIFSKNRNYNVKFIVAGSHLDKNFGYSINEIKKDKIKIYRRIKIPLKTNDLENTASYFNKLQKRINLLLKKNIADIVFLSSDRFETLAFAIEAYLKKIPIIHYEGGDLTEGGALDDNIRHAITKLSHLHLTTNKDALRRVINMGEENWRCLNVGYSPLYYLKKKKFNMEDIKNKFSLDSKKPLILFTLHPIIKNEIKQKKDVNEIFDSLEHLSKNYQIIITYPNFDPGYKYIIYKIDKLNKIKTVRVIKHLGIKNYHSLLFYIGKNKKGFCMGNSSSGIKEAVVFECPTLNIGDRQKSRLKTRNVIDVNADKKKIIKTINTKLKNYKKIDNPYKSSMSIDTLPRTIFKKLLRDDFKLKKCTI